MKIKSFLDRLLDTIFPKFCLGCNKFGEILCLRCKNSLPESEPTNIMGAFSAVDFNNPLVRKIVTKLKYGGIRSLAPVCAQIVDSYIKNNHNYILDKNNRLLLIPVPMTRQKMRKRGFNQANLIAAEFVNINGNNAFFQLETGALSKTKETESQVNIKDKRKRQTNQVGAFALQNKDIIKDRTILLFDDVLTTGATTKECRKVLISGGARNVIIVTFAHQPKMGKAT